jgi:hypothetical protein
MSTPKISVSDPSKLIVRQARTRTAAEAPEGPSFGSVLKTGANVVLRGVETAAGIVGGPLVSGAIRGGSVALEGGGYGSGAGGGAGDDGSFDQVRALQEQAQAFNLQYLAIQEQVQQENRRFTTLSNVAKALHDTNKAVLQNVRS